MPNLNPVIEKSSSGILSGGYRYTYVLNNPLKYTDPSGYTYVPRDYEWENSIKHAKKIEGKDVKAFAMPISR